MMLKKLAIVCFVIISCHTYAADSTTVVSPPQQISCDPAKPVPCTDINGVQFKYLIFNGDIRQPPAKGIYNYVSAEASNNVPYYSYTNSQGTTVVMKTFWYITAAIGQAGGMDWTQPVDKVSKCGTNVNECGYTNLPFIKQ